MGETTLELTIKATKRDYGEVVCQPSYTIEIGPDAEQGDLHELAKRALNAARATLHLLDLLDNPYCTQASNTDARPQETGTTGAAVWGIPLQNFTRDQYPNIDEWHY
jgi:hypothetical protein